jgi:hypothetical protein
LAITTRFTWGLITLATAAALPVASTTTISSRDQVVANAVSVRPERS